MLGKRFHDLLSTGYSGTVVDNDDVKIGEIGIAQCPQTARQLVRVAERRDHHRHRRAPACRACSGTAFMARQEAREQLLGAAGLWPTGEALAVGADLLCAVVPDRRRQRRSRGSFEWPIDMDDCKRLAVQAHQQQRVATPR